jgi:uncharacterized repeat protein (TIGR03803 family)
MATGSRAQVFTTLYSFTGGTDGANPYKALIQATDGNFYGTTPSGGNVCISGYYCGTVFKITPGGTLTNVYEFSGTDGRDPAAGLVQGSDGSFYGTTWGGGAAEDGTIFKITPNGSLTTLYDFAGTHTSNPAGTLVQATDGNFYGTTFDGGKFFDGTVFKVTRSGTLTTLQSFDLTHGGNPSVALVQAPDGNFYGTSFQGGTGSCEGYHCGIVVDVTPEGSITTLHSFDATEGGNPRAALVQATDGNFYGTTAGWGNSTYFGTVFKITPSGTLTTLYSFGGGIDGAYPYAALVQATDGNFYGTTSSGGTYGFGTIFRITPGGTLSTIQSFTDANATPYAGLLQATDGNFYGLTYYGGVSRETCSGGCGTVFKLSVGLAPFVEAQTNSGRVGATVKILGTNLTGASRVTFNDTEAAFTIPASSYISAVVPEGATTGYIQVTTLTGTLASNVMYRVMK